MLSGAAEEQGDRPGHVQLDSLVLSATLENGEATGTLTGDVLGRRRGKPAWSGDLEGWGGSVQALALEVHS